MAARVQGDLKGGFGGALAAGNRRGPLELGGQVGWSRSFHDCPLTSRSLAFSNDRLDLLGRGALVVGARFPVRLAALGGLRHRRYQPEADPSDGAVAADDSGPEPIRALSQEVWQPMVGLEATAGLPVGRGLVVGPHATWTRVLSDAAITVDGLAVIPDRSELQVGLAVMVIGR